MNEFIKLLKKIHIHPLLWAAAGLAILTAHFIELIMLFIIIFIHELGHGVTAHVFSWRIKRISLLPFGGVAEMDEHGNRSLREELCVVAAGPLQHLWMMGGAKLLYTAEMLSSYNYDLFIQFNLMVLFFNLLPIWPLDGGKLLSVFLGYKLNFITAFQWTLILSFAALLVFHTVVLLTVPFHLNLWIILSFLYFSLWMEWKQRKFTFMRFLLERYYGKSGDVRELKPLEINGEETIYSVLEKFHRGFKHPLIVYIDGKEAGKLDENEILHAYFTEKMTTAKSRDLLYLY